MWPGRLMCCTVLCCVCILRACEGMNEDCFLDGFIGEGASEQLSGKLAMIFLGAFLGRRIVIWFEFLDSIGWRDLVRVCW